MKKIKFFESLFWLGLVLVLASMIYPRWYLLTIAIGIVLMVAVVLFEKRPEDIEERKLAMLHRIILVMSLIAVGANSYLNKGIFYSLVAGFYGLPLSLIVGILLVAFGLLVGYAALFGIGKKRRWRLDWGWLKFKRRKKRKKPKKAVAKKIAVKPKVKHAIMPRIIITLFIFAVTAAIILKKQGRFPTGTAAIIGLYVLCGFFIVYIFVGVCRFSARKKVVKADAKVEIKKIQKDIIAKASKYETNIDRLYKLIIKSGCVKVSDAAKMFNISKEQAEEWGRVLEGHGMIELDYPAIGELQLCKKNSKNTK